VAVNNGEIVECDAKKNINIIDLTGAGDLFAAGYLHGIINNLSTKESLLKGTELSSKIIQKIGARI
jgi:fructokinase